MKKFLTIKNVFLLAGFAFLVALPFSILNKTPKIQKDDTINPYPVPKDPASAHIQKASEHYFFREFPEAEEHYRKAIHIYEERKDFLHAAKTYESLGDLFLWAREPNEAKENYLIAVKYFSDQKNILGEANALKELGDMFMGLNEIVESEKWYKQALEILKKEKPNRVLGAVHEGMGHLYWKADKITQAVNSFTLARDTFGTLNYNLGYDHMTNVIDRLQNGKNDLHPHALRRDPLTGKPY